MDVLPNARRMGKTEWKLVSIYVAAIRQQQLKELSLVHTSYIGVLLQNIGIAHVSSL